MHRLATAFAIALLALAPLPAAAQDLGAIEAAEQALDAAWEATPLSFRKVLFASEVIGYGAYIERADTRFRVGKRTIGVRRAGWLRLQGQCRRHQCLGYRVDVRIKTAGGELVLEQNGAARSR